MFFAEPTSIHGHHTTARRRHPIAAFTLGALLTVTTASTLLAQGSEILAVYDGSQPSPNVDVAFELDTQESVAGYVWSFGDGNYSFDAQPTHTYQQEGEFAVSVDVTTTSGTNFTVDAPDLVVIHNQIIADDFDSPMDPLWGMGADQNQEPYGNGMAMGFWMYRGGIGNHQMPNGGIGVSNGAGSGGGDCIKFDCPFPVDRGLFRFQAEIIPMALMSGTELTLFKLEGAEVEIQLRWSFGVLQARTVFQHVKTSWQNLGMVSFGVKSSSGIKGRFEVALLLAGPGMLSDSLDVLWIPDQGSTALSWHSVTTGASPWSAMAFGAFNAVYPVPGGLDPQGQVWIDNFEILRYSLGGVPLP